MALLLLLLLHLTLSPLATCYSSTCGGSNSTTTAAYRSNLNLLLDSFSSANSTFSTKYEGSNPDRIYSLALCRGDISLPECTACLPLAALDITQSCPNYTQATVWLDSCQIRYSDTPFFNSVDYSTRVTYWNTKTAADPIKFSALEAKLLEKLVDRAAFNSPIEFATGTAVESGVPKIYGLVQCTRDLSLNDCAGCLRQIIDDFSRLHREQVGGQSLSNSCVFRYEVYPFFHGKPYISLSLPSSPAATPPDVHAEKAGE